MVYANTAVDMSDSTIHDQTAQANAEVSLVPVLILTWLPVA